jgi:hypothetical protein
MMTQPDPARQSGLALSYLGLRRGIGFLGLALPVVLVLGTIWLGGGGVRGSISSYYYTVMRDYFVGTNCAMGVLLIAYRYRREDSYLSNAVAVFAVGLALFPTTPALAHLTVGQTIVGYVHLACASLFFLGMAYFSLFLFTRTDPHRIATPQKRSRNVLYRVCGTLIVACLVLVVASDFAFTDHVKDGLHPVFWLECIAVWAFSVSWLIKGEFLFLTDQAADLGRGQR